MINKRLLIRNLLNHNDENSFYDKKLKIDLDSKEGKAKFLKHICALSNSNPENNSYIVIGVQDETNKIMGVDFFDDSRIQDLVNACLVNPPVIRYENISFPSLPRHKVVGLVTIFPTYEITYLKKNYWKYDKGMIFYRQGSTSNPVEGKTSIDAFNKGIVQELEKSSSSNVELLLNSVFDFMEQHPSIYNPTYLVFKEYFVLCWAGEKKEVDNVLYYSRVDIELVKEQVRIFYSALDDVQIQINKDSFIITEYVYLGIHSFYKYYPLEKTILHFKENGQYNITTEFLFEPPVFEISKLELIYEKNEAVLEKLLKGEKLIKEEQVLLEEFPHTYLICSMNGFEQAKEKLMKSKMYLKRIEDKTVYVKYKEVMRIFRKVKYGV